MQLPAEGALAYERVPLLLGKTTKKGDSSMAVRSNSKAAKEAIREYIRETIATRSDESRLFDNCTSLAETCKAYCEYLDHIFRNDYTMRTTASRIRHDIDGGGAWEICTYERAKLVGSWLQQDEATIDNYYERGMCDDTFRNLIVREIMQLAGR